MDRLFELIENLKIKTQNNSTWNREFEDLLTSTMNIHLAIFIEPYLQWIIDGKKSIESRFSINKCAPFGRIKKGDIIVMKRSGGPVVALAKAGIVWSYNLDPESWVEIKGFSKAICAQDPSFWEKRSSACFATLIKVENVLEIDPVSFPKRDRRGWLILKNGDEPELNIK